MSVAGEKRGESKKPRGNMAAVRRRRAWELAAEQHTYQEIADILDREGLGRVCMQAVWKMVKKVDEEANELFMKNVLGEKTRQTEFLKKQVRRLMADWEASRKPQKVLNKKDGAGDGVSSGAAVTVKDSYGDPRIASEIRMHLSEIRKIWGMDAPQKLDMSGSMEIGTGSFDELRRKQFADWSPVELEKLAMLQGEVEGRKRAEGEERQGTGAGTADS